MLWPNRRQLACALWLGLAPGAEAASYADSELARVGQAAPDTGGGSFSQFLQTRVNGSGGVAFYARVSLSGAHPAGIFVREADSLRKVVMPGDAAPAPVGATFLSIESISQVPAFNDHGDVLFAASVPPTRGLFLASQGAIVPVVIAGDAAPPPAVGHFFFFSQNGMDLNDAGDLVFGAWIQDDSSGGPIFRDAVVFRPAGGSLAVLAVEDGPAPEGIGGTYSGFGSPTLNSHGDVAFFAGVDNGSSPRVIVATSGGASHVVAARGDPAPGTGGGSFLDFNDRVTIDDSGRVLFRASVLQGFVSHGVFLRTQTGVAPIALPGGPAPGIPGGTISYLPQPASLGRSGIAVLPALVETPAGSVHVLLAASDGVLGLIRKDGDPAPGGGLYAELTQEPTIASDGNVSFTSALTDGGAGAFLATRAAEVPAASDAFRIAAAAALVLTGISAARRVKARS
jgi:hypothetical protein